MIRTEFYKQRSDGVNLDRTYSDAGFSIIQDQTGVEYDEAVDVENSSYTYTETENLIPQDTEDALLDLKKEMQSMVAPVENTDIATRNYDPNDMLMLNNNVYKVIEPIGIRSRIVEYYNVVPTTVGAQLSELINNTEE